VARKTASDQQVDVQFESKGTTGFHTVHKVTIEPNASCYFVTPVRFPGSGTVRLAWNGSGQPEYSRPQAITL
jgi:hypothetical protein